ncbi:membrane peptidoglycan carboxypeptidase [Frondihabitans sp. PhB188]|uniref:transglycosylase domain-containing protein n=1 Tax=Frondihabitans sp. PhB188 TaxID=2485200 RepID=UPI000F4A9B91|nr:transglycosylase domain-containing protein [Frondihabitans sp. PhB188]ROQ40115.1 membrane peptidoglycan carboxypeptidase [Frondihabitans sp. PhB188]
MTAPTSSSPRALRALTGFSGLAVVAGLLVAVLAVPALVVVSNTVTTGVTAFDSLPGYLAITPPAQATSVYAKDGSKEVKIASFYTENRTDVTADQISQNVKDAAVAAEDPRFYDEGAIDLQGTIRGILATTLGGDVQGGSSITQQYVKNVLVERCATENTDAAKAEKCYEDVTAVTPQRKLREMRYAITVEKKYSKSEILTGYLNIVGFGGNIYGIQAAAEYYFGVSASALNVAQSATLVAILNNPSNLRIDEPANASNGSADHYALTKVRRDYVLQRMYVHGKITKAELTAAKASVIAPHITASTNGCAAAVKYDAGYFCDYVTNVIKNDTAFGSTADARLQSLNEGGLKIYTTLNLAQQRTAQASLSAYMPTTVSGLNVGASNVSVEPGSGRILTMVQNTDYTQSDQAAAGSSAVNYNTDQAYGGSTGFQTGSSFKAFTLAAWLEAGHTLSDYVTTGTHDFSFAQFTASCTNLGAGTWPVANAESVPSSMSVLTATQESINTAYADMGTQLDLCDIIDAAKAMDVHTATTGGSLSVVPSAILGTNTIAPLTMAVAYAGIANGGVVCTPVAIDSITGPDGAIAATPTTCTQGMSSDVAAGVSYALQTVLKAGGTGSLANPGDGVDMLAKTGTNDNAEQNWLVTSTTKVATATWVGNVSGSAGFYDTYINGVYGYNLKFLIAKPILQSLDAEYGGDTLTAPPASELGTTSSSSDSAGSGSGSGSGSGQTGATSGGTGGAQG